MAETSVRSKGRNSWQRYEIKYLISEREAARVRAFCDAHLPIDEHSVNRPDRQYPISSIYLDSPDLQCFRATIDKYLKRMKLRIRTYRSRECSPSGSAAFFEIKRREKDIISKTRAHVSPQLAECLIWNAVPYSADVGGYCIRCEDCSLRINTRACQALNEFLDLRARIQARPTVGVFYTREAYEGQGLDRVRITLDRHLHYGLLSNDGGSLREVWWPAGLHDVILEIKFTGTFPFWVSDLIHRCDVMRRGVCKYVICIRGAGLGRTSARMLA